MVENEEHENTRNHDQCGRLHGTTKMIKNNTLFVTRRNLLFVWLL